MTLDHHTNFHRKFEVRKNEGFFSNEVSSQTRTFSLKTKLHHNNVGLSFEGIVYI